MDRTRLYAMLVVFVALVGGGILLVALHERETGQMMITSAIGLVGGGAIAVTPGPNGRSSRASSPPPFTSSGDGSASSSRGER
jgi:hypothetical protein